MPTDRSDTPRLQTRRFHLFVRPPTQGKTEKEKEENTAQSKLRFKTFGPFRVLDATPDTVTILEDGTRLQVSIDRCVPNPGPEDKDRQEKPNSDKTTLTLETQRPVTYQLETILHHDHDPTLTIQTTDDLQQTIIFSNFVPVSYTHLTLPTILLV